MVPSYYHHPSMLQKLLSLQFNAMLSDLILFELNELKTLLIPIKSHNYKLSYPEAFIVTN